MIEGWPDWVDDPVSRDFVPPVFTVEERAAIASFHSVWVEVAENTPGQLPPLEETLQLPAWDRLRVAAERTLGVFNRRGRLPEEQGI